MKTRSKIKAVLQTKVKRLRELENLEIAIDTNNGMYFKSPEIQAMELRKVRKEIRQLKKELGM